ncbi:MAG: ABC transporter ATP-binding protein [Eubacteriales bacterium]|nr:ABC transporter ATP-binding protein [Eubacteriales bacterium]
MRKENDRAATKWTIALLKGQWRWVILSSVLASISAVSGVIMVLFMRNMINAAVAADATRTWTQFALFATLIALQYIFGYINSRVIGAAQIRFNTAVKRRIMRTIFNKDYSAVRKYHSGELMNRITADVDMVTSTSMSLIPGIVSMVVRVICAGVVLSILSWELIVLIVGFGAVVGLCMLVFRKPLKRLQRAVRDTEGKTRGFMQESLLNLPVVKAFAASDVFSQKLDEYQDASIRARIRHLRFSSLAHTGLGVAFAFVYIVALAYGGYSLLHTVGFDYGSFMAILQLVSQVRSPLAGMTEILPKFYSMLVSSERLMDIENLKDEQQTQPMADIDKIKEFSRIVAQGVTFGYDNGDCVLSNVDLSIDRGDLVVLSGRSGIGKSTLMKLMLALYKPDSGRLYLQSNGEEQDLTAQTRPIFAYVPQGNLLFAGSIRDNITLFSKRCDENRIKEALRVACMDDFVATLPDGIDTILMEDGAGVSEGQAQRIAVARAVLYDAPVLLLDEATSALDEQTELRMLTNIKSVGRTCFIISHRSSVNEIATRHLVMRDTHLYEN